MMVPASPSMSAPSPGIPDTECDFTNLCSRIARVAPMGKPPAKAARCEHHTSSSIDSFIMSPIMSGAIGGGDIGEEIPSTIDAFDMAGLEIGSTDDDTVIQAAEAADMLLSGR